MKKIFYISLVIVSLTAINLSTLMGQSKTQYFQPAYSQRHNLNPAFAPQWGYFSLPALGKTDIMLRSNLGLSNFLFPLENGSLGTFLHPEVSTEQFLGTLHKLNYLDSELQISLLSIGWYKKQSFWSIDLDMDVLAGVTVPYELFQFAKQGMYENPTSYSIENLQINLNTFASASVGYSRQINQNLRVGGKVKFVISFGAAEMNLQQLNLNLSEEKWSAQASGEANAIGSFFDIRLDSAGHYESIALNYKEIRPVGYGAAIDLGVEYAFSDQLKGLNISLSATDLGFIYYNKKHITRAEANAAYEFDGIDNISNTDDLSGALDQVLDDLSNALQYQIVDPENITRRLNTTLNVGVEYAFYKNKFSVGLLSSTIFGTPKILTELTASFNVRPVNWFSCNVSYSFANVFTTIGGSLNLTPSKIINLFLSCDYVSLRNNPQFIPLKDAHFNFQLGLTFPIGKNRAENN